MLKLLALLHTAVPHFTVGCILLIKQEETNNNEISTEFVLHGCRNDLQALEERTFQGFKGNIHLPELRIEFGVKLST